MLKLRFTDDLYRKYLPSRVAAATVAASRSCLNCAPIWNSHLENLTGYRWTDVQPIVDIMLGSVNDIKIFDRIQLENWPLLLFYPTKILILFRRRKQFLLAMFDWCTMAVFLMRDVPFQDSEERRGKTERRAHYRNSAEGSKLACHARSSRHLRKSQATNAEQEGKCSRFVTISVCPQVIEI